MPGQVLATVEDMAALHGGMLPTQQAQAEALLPLLTDALVRRARVPVAGNENVFKLVICDVAWRRVSLGDMDGIKSEQVTAGSYSAMATFDNPAGDLYLTDEQKKLLGIRDGAASAGSYFPYGPPDGGGGDEA